MPDASDTVSVEIRGQRYPIRSRLDAAYVSELAHYVDESMQKAADATSAVDTARLAVLAALNIADDYFQCRERRDVGQDVLLQRTRAIEHLVDEALRLTGD